MSSYLPSAFVRTSDSLVKRRRPEVEPFPDVDQGRDDPRDDHTSQREPKDERESDGDEPEHGGLLPACPR
jgi:hypothetical protein